MYFSIKKSIYPMQKDFFYFCLVLLGFISYVTTVLHFLLLKKGNVNHSSCNRDCQTSLFITVSKCEVF